MRKSPHGDGALLLLPNGRDGAMVRDAQYCMILAYAHINQLEQAASLANRVQLTAQQRQAVNRTVISKLSVQSFEKKRYRQALDDLDRLSRETGMLNRGLALMLLRTGNRIAAREQFRRIHAAAPGQDSLEGIVETR